jgi:catechol 2,3-dioxygenase-like lactoylglutathione lyase family enzyme
MVQLTALHHVSFVVPDLGAAMGFWRDLLGFEIMQRPDMGVAGAWLNGFGVEVHLVVPPEAPAAEGRLNPLRNHVAFRVDDLAAMRGKLEAAGVEVLGGPGGIRQMFVLDPGANLIEFIQPSTPT